ncbi:MAG TPA: hypothetical protein VIM03_00945 [Thermoleophilaceae bacterium]
MKRPQVIAIVAALTLGVAGAPAVSGAGAARDPVTYGPPAIKPANFVRNVDNPWFPLKPGTTLTYAGVKDGKQARNVFHVTHKTEKIKGVRATVIRDRLYLDGKLGEDTTDWYAQDKRGDVVYLGESTRALDANGQLTDTRGLVEDGGERCTARHLHAGAPEGGADLPPGVLQGPRRGPLQCPQQVKAEA